MDGDLGRADLNLERHGPFRAFAGRQGASRTSSSGNPRFRLI
jgi:hypothetical protein